MFLGGTVRAAMLSRILRAFFSWGSHASGFWWKYL